MVAIRGKEAQKVKEEASIERNKKIKNAKEEQTNTTRPQNLKRSKRNTQRQTGKN